MLRRIVDVVARTEQAKKELKEDLRQTRHHIEYGWRERPSKEITNTLLLHVVGKTILEIHNALSGPDVEWRWPVAISKAALDFALTVPGMRLSVCGDTIYTPGLTTGECEAPTKPRTIAQGKQTEADLDESGLAELHKARERERISFCMRKKDFAPLSLGVACAMGPLLLKADYRPADKPRVRSFDEPGYSVEIVYRLSVRRKMMTEDLWGEEEEVKVTHAGLVDGLEAAAKAADKRPASGGCVIQ